MYYSDYSKEILGRSGMFDKADIEAGKVKLDPNYGLVEAKKGWKNATSDADRKYYEDMGKYFRANGATLDPDNKMDYDQLSKAYSGQFGGSAEGGDSGGPYTQGDYFSQANGYINDYMSTMNGYMNQYNEAGLAMLRDYQTNYAQALDRLRQLMETKSDVPESVKQSISLLRDQTAENAKLIDEQLANMGVLYSGRTGNEHDTLYKNMDAQTAGMLNNWLDREHEKMYQAALKMADMQASYANNYANLSSQWKLGALDKAMGLAGQEYQMRSGLARDQFDYGNAQKAAEAQAAAAEEDRYWDNYWKQKQYTTPDANAMLSYQAALARLGGGGSSDDSWSRNHATAVKMASDNIKPSQFTDSRTNVTNWNAYYSALDSAVREYEAQLNDNPATRMQLDESTYTDIENLIARKRAEGFSDTQIANALRNDGYEPTYWGLR